MYCQSCGTSNQDGASYCSSCGKSLHQIVKQPSADEMMGFTTAIATCFSKYFDFSGRATRAEYWWFFLFTFLLHLTADMADRSGGISLVLSIAFFFPSLFAATRRLHDIGRSGWWQLIALTIIGIIPLIVMLCLPSEYGPNEYGE